MTPEQQGLLVLKILIIPLTLLLILTSGLMLIAVKEILEEILSWFK